MVWSQWVLIGSEGWYTVNKSSYNNCIVNGHHAVKFKSQLFPTVVLLDKPVTFDRRDLLSEKGF